MPRGSPRGCGILSEMVGRSLSLSSNTPQAFRNEVRFSWIGCWHRIKTEEGGFSPEVCGVIFRKFFDEVRSIELRERHLVSGRYEVPMFDHQKNMSEEMK